MRTTTLQIMVMGRKANPMRDRALKLMRTGLATPGEIARSCGLPKRLVDSWRQRSGIWTQPRRLVHVRRLMLRGIEHGEGIPKAP